MIDLDEAERVGQTSKPWVQHRRLVELVQPDGDWDCVADCACEGDAAFICYARNNWDAIIARLREADRLEAEVEELKRTKPGIEYHLNVLNDGNKQRLYVVQSGTEIPENVLQLAGLLLDLGLFSNEEVIEKSPLAASYVSVERVLSRAKQTVQPIVDSEAGNEFFG